MGVAASADLIAPMDGRDLPNTTSQQTYAPCFKSNGANNHIYCVQTNTPVCSITATEIQG